MITTTNFKESTTLHNIINLQVNYFASYKNQESTLIEMCSDNANVNSKYLQGSIFTNCLLLEAIKLYREWSGNNVLIPLETAITAHLIQAFTKGLFNYFDSPYLPQDLDTASFMTRLLHQEHPKILSEYNNIVSRNRNSDYLIPTWLDTDEHDRFFSGKNPIHFDVILNHWLTETALGNPIRLEAISKLTDEVGLTNYWYLPALYTPYMYSRLLSVMNLQNDAKFRKPIESALKDWDHNNAQYVKRSSQCQYEKVIGLVKKHGESDINLFFRFYIHSLLTSKEKANNAFDFNFLTTAMESSLNDPLYWSVGLKPFSSTVVNRAIIMTCLIHALINLGE